MRAPQQQPRPWLRLLPLCLMLLWPSAAEATPWTLQRGTARLSVGAEFQNAGREYLINGAYQPFSLNGSLFGAHLRLGLRYGITDRAEIAVRAGFSHIAYGADEAYIPGENTPDFDEFQNREEVLGSVLSFDQTATGLGDLFFAFRYRVTPDDNWHVSAAPEIEVKVPTGYRSPLGTFTEDDPSQGVADDVTLGDGQLDITARMHLGLVPVPRWFLRFDGGIRVRLFGPGQQVVGGFKTGVRIGRALVPTVGVEVEHSFTQGQVVGTSYSTLSPETPASELTAEDIILLEYRPDRTFVKPSAGLIISFEEWDLQVNYSVIAWGVNIAQVHSVFVGSSVRLGRREE